MAFDQWLVFVAIWTVAALPLGPNALNCITSAANDGVARALWVIVGIAVAALCHMTATVFGVATILLANAALFQALKLIGAGYLIWMGVSLWRSHDRAITVARRAPVSPWCLARRGFLVSMTNPKAIFAYLAVFSQFVKPGAPLTDQLVVLMPTALVIITLVYAGYTVLGGGIGQLLATVRRRVAFNRTVGGVYILSGLGLAATGGASR